MGLIAYYLIFALATALFALIDVFIPALQQARINGIKNTMTDNPLLSYLVYVGITAITAPIVVVPLLVPSMNMRFKTSLYKALTEEE